MMNFLPFARPSITDAEKEAVLQVLDSGWITTGPHAKTFESRFAETVGVRHAIALNSATAALHVALQAAGVGAGDDVVVPTWTFAASAEVVVHLGARPVLVDIEETTLNATPEAILQALSPRTKAVVAVHFAGLPLEVPRLAALLEERGVALIEDAAHSFPSRITDSADRYAGTFGRAGAFSFYATKTITTGEGGMLVTQDDAIAARARVLALHGISAHAWNRYAKGGSWYYEIEAAGYKYNLTDIAAALGLVQLARAEELFDARKALARAYARRMATSPVADLVDLPVETERPEHAIHLYVVRLRLDRLTIDRARVLEQMAELGVGTSVHFIPLHLHPYYRREWGYSPSDLPVATRMFECVASLPIWPGMSEADVDRVASALETVLGSARR
jgi:dTDP-4-amino-4,6-dideoxygalactose transaminase